MDATRHGLFRRLRRRASRAPLDPDSYTVPATTVIQSPWLRSAFGLEVTGLPARLLAATTVPTEPVLAPVAGTTGEAWPDPEHIVERVWVFEPEPHDGQD
jgi:hypothetical protein